MMRSNSALQTKVGLLILVSLVILGAAIFLMGRERQLFERRVSYEIHFSRTIGLREGAPVSLAGVTVGRVESLAFPPDPKEHYIAVQIRIVGEVASRIRKDTVARIRTLGLLGDKFIELSGGSAQSEPLRPGSLIASIDPVDYEALLGEGKDVVTNVIEATSSLSTILKSIEEGRGLVGQMVSSDAEGKWAETASNLRSASVSLKNILQSVEKGQGLVGQLVRNKEAGEAMMQDLRTSLSQLRKVTDSLQKTTEKIEKGEGTLGTLIQDPESGKEILTNLRRAATNLEVVTRQLREGGGLLHRLIADRPYAERLLGNLDQTTKDLSEITGKIERGEGTIGALVNDPALYKNANELVGDAKGSWLFSIYRFFRNFSGPKEPSGETPPQGENKGKD
jgi:phospholipid/cholesterol/gamma-HCH transport system substrate-binding protein